MTKQEIIDFSGQLLEQKKTITSADASFNDYKEQIASKLNADNLNRIVFIDNASILSALSLEFRNIYGIEAPFYEIKDCRVGIDKNATGNISENDIVAFGDEDGYFKDCPEVISAAMFDSNSVSGGIISKEDDSSEFLLLPFERQKFFVDELRNSDSSQFFDAMCPPGYDKWAGAYLYDKICKPYLLTEIKLYELLNSYKSIDSSQITISGLNSSNSLSCNINSSGKITKTSYFYTFSNEKLLQYEKEGNSVYKINEVSKEIEDKNPIKYYQYSVQVTSTPHYDEESVIEYYEYTYSNNPFSKTLNPIVSYTLGTFCNGYAILCAKPIDFPTQGDEPISSINVEYCIDILTQNGPLYQSTDSADWQNEYSWLVNKKSSGYITSKNPYSAIFSAVNQNDNNVKAAILSYYKNSLINVLNYYNYYSIERKKTCKIEINTSMETMQNVIDAINIYENNKTASNLDNAINAIKNRIRYILHITTTDDERKYNLLFETGRRYEGSVGSLPASSTMGKTYTLSSDGKKYSFYKNGVWDVVSNNIGTAIPGSDNVIYDTAAKRLADVVYDLETRPHVLINLAIDKYSAEYQNRNITPEIYTLEFTGPKPDDISGEDKGIENTIEGLDGLKETLESHENPVFHNIFDMLSTYSVYNPISKIINDTGTDGASFPVSGVTGKVDVTVSVIINKYPFDGIIPTENSNHRAVLINNFLAGNKALYDLVFQTITNRINKRTGTLREAYVMLNSTNFATQTVNKKKKNISDLFKIMTLFEIKDGFGGDTITIEAAPWEPDTVMYSTLSRLSKVNIVCDDENLFITTKVIDISKASEKSSDGRTGAMFNVVLQDKIDKDFKLKNPRLVKILE